MAILPRRRGAQAAHYHYLAETLRELEFQIRGRIDESGLIPEEWREIACQRGPLPKVKVTFWVEGEVVKFFRGTGQGWTTRMSEVLRAFMLARRAGILSGAEGVEYVPMGGEERRHRIAVLRELAGLNAEEQDEERATRPTPSPDPAAKGDEAPATTEKAGTAIADMWKIIQEMRSTRGDGDGPPDEAQPTVSPAPDGTSGAGGDRD